MREYLPGEVRWLNQGAEYSRKFEAEERENVRYARARLGADLTGWKRVLHVAFVRLMPRAAWRYWQCWSRGCDWQPALVTRPDKPGFARSETEAICERCGSWKAIGK